MISKIRSFYRRKFWSPSKYAKYIGVKFGNGCSIRTKFFGAEPYLIEIGNNVEITADVRFYNHGAGWLMRDIDKKFDCFGKITVGDNVYIGESTLVLPGVTVGDNVLIGAGSVVTKSIPDNSIVGGNPAKIIGDVSSFKEKYKKYNVKTKGMGKVEKRKVLESLPDEKFIKK